MTKSLNIWQHSQSALSACAVDGDCGIVRYKGDEGQATDVDFCSFDDSVLNSVAAGTYNAAIPETSC